MRTATQKIPNGDVGTLVASQIISTGPIKLLSLILLNTKNSLQYIQVHESATLPADAANPDVPSIPVGAGAIVMIDFGPGIDLDACTVCNSSSATQKTIGAADCQIQALIAV